MSILFIQFIHPGKEHNLNQNNANHIPWNTRNHKRKFLINSGRYLENDSIKEDELILWGEWEV